MAWVTDVSEFRFNRKRLYLSVIQDLYNGNHQIESKRFDSWT